MYAQVTGIVTLALPIVGLEPPTTWIDDSCFREKIFIEAFLEATYWAHYIIGRTILPGSMNVLATYYFSLLFSPMDHPAFEDSTKSFKSKFLTHFDTSSY